MAAAVSKKGLTLAKLTTWMELKNQGILAPDRLALAVKEGIAKDEIAPQTEEVFAAQSAELLAFAKELNLIKTKSAPFGKKGKSYEDYIIEQYPAAKAGIDAVHELSKQTFKITLDSGDVVTVQPLPFYRNISPKSATPTTADVPSTEGAVVV